VSSLLLEAATELREFVHQTAVIATVLHRSTGQHRLIAVRQFRIWRVQQRDA